MAPLVTAQELIAYIKALDLGYEVFDEFPRDKTNVRNGIYVNDPTTAERRPYSLAVRYGGNIYYATDNFVVILVSFQDDISKDAAAVKIADMLFDNDLFDGYHERDYSQDQEFINRAEYRTFTFRVTRLEFQ